RRTVSAASGARSLCASGRDPQASLRPRPHARTGDRRVRAAQAASAGPVERAVGEGGGALHLGRDPVADAGPRRAREARGGVLLRGEAALPPDPPAHPPGADGLRAVRADPPAHPGVLLPAARGHPREPRPLAADAAVRLRHLAALADGEDPGASAPDP